ncbi:MAG: hypothetical protein Q4G45_14115, partial [Actinomycetia bacterium]|nr:hypothetical protein [Actinomycetes bacterium]
MTDPRTPEERPLDDLYEELDAEWAAGWQELEGVVGHQSGTTATTDDSAATRPDGAGPGADGPTSNETCPDQPTDDARSVDDSGPDRLEAVKAPEAAPAPEAAKTEDDLLTRPVAQPEPAGQADRDIFFDDAMYAPSASLAGLAKPSAERTAPAEPLTKPSAEGT